MAAGERRLGSAWAILLVAAGLALAAGGASLLGRIGQTADLVALGIGVRDGTADLSHGELRATADRLAASSASARSADAAGALTFLYYAAAQASRRAGDAAAMGTEMAAARQAGIETLASAP